MEEYERAFLRNQQKKTVDNGKQQNVRVDSNDANQQAVPDLEKEATETQPSSSSRHVAGNSTVSQLTTPSVKTKRTRD